MGMITEVSTYFVDGCGRCNHFATDSCKARIWSKPLAILREILLSSGLEEDAKWGQPTYSLNGKNVAMLFSFKDCCGISFFKGILLQDDHKILVPAGVNSHVAKLLKITSEKDAQELEPLLHKYLNEAIKIEKSGKPVPKRAKDLSVPSILQERMNTDELFKKAWDALTPGRQRSYIIYISGAKQEATKRNRLEKALPKILAGKGNNEY